MSWRCSSLAGAVLLYISPSAPSMQPSVWWGPKRGKVERRRGARVADTKVQYQVAQEEYAVLTTHCCSRSRPRETLGEGPGNDLLFPSPPGRRGSCSTRGCEKKKTPPRSPST
ncbi:hypothetical protein V8E36_008768 [Tilletia maclaganii]